jgi:hypothetical protein
VSATIARRILRVGRPFLRLKIRVQEVSCVVMGATQLSAPCYAEGHDVTYLRNIEV